MRAVALVACWSAVLLAGGCSSDAEPKSYRVSGEAKYDGKAIPYGEVLFTPDGAAGNSGPQGIAIIHDGQYDTNTVEGKGIAGGPTVIRVTALDKQGGNLLCEVEYKADLPRADGTHNIDVPAGKAPPPKKKKGPEI
jgi:hypothetical protein